MRQAERRTYTPSPQKLHDIADELNVISRETHRTDRNTNGNSDKQINTLNLIRALALGIIHDLEKQPRDE